LRVDGEKLRVHVDEVVRSSVEETLNRLLDAEADRICRAQLPRALTRASRHARRSLGAQARDEDRRGDADGAEAATAAVRPGLAAILTMALSVGFRITVSLLILLPKLRGSDSYRNIQITRDYVRVARATLR
jgi:hypothetical protein